MGLARNMMLTLQIFVKLWCFVVTLAAVYLEAADNV